MALPALPRDTLSIPTVGAPLFIVSNPDLAYLGTRFTASKEGNATDASKQCIIDSTGEAVLTRLQQAAE